MELHAQTQQESLRYWVWLSLVFGAGSAKLLQYLQKTGSPQAVYDAVQAGMFRDLPPIVQKAVREHSLGEADSLVYFCRTHDITLLPIDSAEYPSMLRDIGTPPVLLTAQGNLELLQNPLSLSVVGTRRPSPYTERVTQTVIGELMPRGFMIVSGFAKGVDSIAHTAALDYGGTTVAVLGCGINVNYPRENTVLRERMLTSGKGLLLSEYLPGTQPFPANFPKRNRILSGLGYATAVMEAAARSGSLLTAQCATDQGRYVYAVPPADLFDARYSGVIPLLRDGAYPLMSYEDILLNYYGHFPQYLSVQENDLRNSERMIYQEHAAPESTEKICQTEKPEASDRQKPKPDAEKTKPAAPPELQPAEKPGFVQSPLPETEAGRQIVSYLREHGETYVDDIAAALDMDLSLLLSELTMLELDGFVDTLFGKHYRAC